MRPCRTFLHKPTLETMKSHGAFLEAKEEGREEGKEEGKERVLVDSSFCIGRDVASTLLDLSRSLPPLTCEVDAYGDFLQPLGSHPCKTYITSPHPPASTELCL